MASEQLNAKLEAAAAAKGLHVQRDVRGRDLGTDGMAAALAGIDCASTSVGFPIRNMHTVSELAHTGDVLGAAFALHSFLARSSEEKLTSSDLRIGHPRLDLATAAEVPPVGSVKEADSRAQ